jgi:GntR family transcriptional regulator
VEIDPHAPEPSYQQLAAILRARIKSGEIGPREPLPSITYLVGETGLAIGTIRKAIGCWSMRAWPIPSPAAARSPPRRTSGPRRRRRTSAMPQDLGVDVSL